MTKIYHYVRSRCMDTGSEVLPIIKEDGFLRRELDIHPNRGDGIDSNLLWLTTDSTMVSGGASNHLGSIIKRLLEMGTTFELGSRLSEGKATFNSKMHSNFENVFIVYEFDAETIGAVSWNKYKKQKGKLSAKMRNYTKWIDMQSELNGDDISDYYVCEEAVDIDLATNAYGYIQKTEHTLALYGFDSYYEVAKLVHRTFDWFDKVYGSKQTQINNKKEKISQNICDDLMHRKSVYKDALKEVA